MADVYHPENEAQLVELLRAGLANTTCFAISGQDTKAGFGYTRQADAGICMGAFNGIIDYVPEELMMRAKAGTPLADLTAILARNNQHLAFEPPPLGRLYASDSSDGTIGGVFMANLSGPRRFLAGAARDHILGIKAVNGRAEVYKSGGNVLKNVTGYDLSKLLCGSWGTLSVVSEISFKVLPAPAFAMSVGIPAMSPLAGLKLLAGIAQSSIQASGLSYLPAANLSGAGVAGGQYKDLCLIRLEGSQKSVMARVNDLMKLLPEKSTVNHYTEEQSLALWQAIGDTAMLNPRPVVLKLSIPPASAPELCRELSSIHDCDWYADAAGAWFWVGLENAQAVDNIKRLRQLINYAGGSAVLYRAADHIKQEAGIFSGMSRGLMALTRRLKDSFDPRHLLNPRRLFPEQ